MQIFSKEWIAAFGEQLSQSPTYKQQAQTWEGTLLLVLNETNTPHDRAIWLDLWHGDCRQVREATVDDFSTADYVLSASLTNWQQILNKDIAPLMAIMRGKLLLKKGSMATLAKYTSAATALVNVAADVPATWDI